jgi:EmrB/QacA subfamily drug resistance transporter
MSVASVASVADERRLRRVIIAAAVTQGAINFDFFAMSMALPEMARDLGTTITGLQWVVSGYLIALGACFVAGGRLGDIFGRKRLLIIGVIAFAATSAVAGAGNDPTMVIVFRVAQGVGAAIAFPVSLAVVTNAFPPARVQRAIGIVFGTAVVGTALGPFLGGLLTELLSWRFVFWLNVPIAVAVIWLVVTSVSESRDESVPRHLDVAGLVLIVAGVGAISFAFDNASDWGWTSAATIGLIVCGLALLVAFVVVEARVRYPLLDLTLFRIRVFDVMISSGTAANVVYTVVIFVSIVYLQQVRALSPIEAGVVFLALSIGASIAGQVSGRVERFPSWLVMVVAMVIGGLGTIALSWADEWALYVPCFAVTGFGLGLAWAFTSVATQAVVPPAKAGAASGVVLTILVGMGGLGVAVASSIIETHGGTNLEAAVQWIIRVSGIVAVLGAGVVSLVGCPRGAS